MAQKPVAGAQSNIQNEFELKKYIKLLLKRKKLIVATAFAFLLVWAVYVYKFKSTPLYETRVTLAFEDPRQMGDINEVRGKSNKENESTASLIKTRVLLANVIKELNLNFSIINENLTKDEAVKYLHLGDASMSGIYKLKIDKGKGRLFYANPQEDVGEKKILEINAGDTVTVNDIKLLPDWELLKSKGIKTLEFQIRDMDRSIENLRNKLGYSMDRNRVILNATVRDKNPEWAAKIANTVAREFVAFNLSMKRRRTEEVLQILDNQLKIAQSELDKSNSKLKTFKEANPWVSISNDANLPLTQITSLGNQANQINIKISDIKDLRHRITNTSDFDSKLAIERELLTYLTSESMPTAPALETELVQLNTERTSILGKYSSEHPIVKENIRKFNALFSKIDEAAKSYVSSQESQKNQLNAQVKVEKYKLSSLPSKELELAELVRNRDVKENLYSTVFTRYNQAKIANEVEVSDVFIIDEAAPPQRYGQLTFFLQNIMLGVIIGLALGVGMAFAVEFFDKTVQDADELQKRLQIPIVGSIPAIEVKEANLEDVEDELPKQDTKLVTLDYSPTIASEAYRELRTKVLFKNQNEELGVLLITSLGPGEGKSLTSANLAITIAQQKIPTLLIDGDLRRGVLHNEFGCKKRPGLSDFLKSMATVDQDNLSKVIQQTTVPNLFLLSSGSQIPNPTEMIGSVRMREIVRVLRSRFGMIIIDSAPLQASSDAAVLANVTDKVMLIIKAGYTNVEMLGDKIREYQIIQEKLIGVVLNGIKVNLKKAYYKYSYYNY